MYKLRIKNKLTDLADLEKFIKKIGQDNNFTAKLIFEINLVLDELITNTIQYGYNDNQLHKIEIEAEVMENIVCLKIIDDARKFDPLQKKEVDTSLPLKEKIVGGLGIFFVKQKVDDIRYEYKDYKNYIYIKKNII